MDRDAILLKDELKQKIEEIGILKRKIVALGETVKKEISVLENAVKDLNEESEDKYKLIEAGISEIPNEDKQKLQIDEVKEFNTQEEIPNDDGGDGTDNRIVNVKSEFLECVDQDQEIEEDKGKSEATFRYTVKNISKMEESQFSPVFYARNLPWRIEVISEELLNEKKQVRRYLGCYLECNSEDESTTWSCQAKAELRLLSCKEGQKPFSRELEELFCSEANSYGSEQFMRWQKVLDPVQGFIKNDSIALEVHVKCDVH